MSLYTLDEHGFYGKKFEPLTNKYPNKVMIAFTGSDGSFKLACRFAEYYSSIGITCMALCYWNITGLPLAMSKVPLESVENAVRQLKKEGFEKVGICGLSKGGEFALLSASYFNEINAVIALAPMHIACMGFKGMKVIESSSWSYKGEEIPYTKGKMSLFKVIKASLKAGEVTMHFVYEDLLKQTNPESVIPVEKINGPILLVSPEKDLMWPSKFACSEVVNRLEAHGFKHDVNHLNYEYASHFIIPFESQWNKMFQIERRHKQKCLESRMDLDKQIQDFIKKW